MPGQFIDKMSGWPQLRQGHTVCTGVPPGQACPSAPACPRARRARLRSARLASQRAATSVVMMLTALVIDGERGQLSQLSP